MRPRRAARAASESSSGRAPKAWQALTDMGVLDALRAEADGGLGLAEVDVILVLEETGRCALPEPIVETMLVGSPLGLVTPPASISVIAPESPLGVWTDTADAVVTLAADGLRTLPRAAVVLTPRASVDPARRLFEVDAPARPADRPLTDVVLAFRRMVLGSAAQLCGLADTMITMTVDYASDRRQFGVPIGSFQAVKHHLADARTALEFARPLVYRAAASMAIRDADAGLHVGMAKAAAGDAASASARAALQCHGAIGYTTEHDLHFFMQRAWALAASWGDARSASRAHRRHFDAQTFERSVMNEAYIVEAVRTPVGRRNGGLGGVHPADLGAHAIRALVERSGIDPAAVEDVVFGCVDTIGPQAGDIARTCWLAAGMPDEVPGTTIDRQCGSSQQAVHFAAQAVLSGTMDVVVAGGVQNMTMIPISSAMTVAQPMGFETPFDTSEGWLARYGDQEVSQFRAAEMIAAHWDISRDEMEQFAVASHERAIRARAEGRFEREIAPIAGVAARRGAARAEPRQDPLAAAARAGRAPDRGGEQPDLRRRGRGPRGERAGAAGARPHPAGAHPPHLGAGRRPRVDADRADPGHRIRAEEGRHVARRHRPRGDQRGLRVRRARVGSARPWPTSTR